MRDHGTRACYVFGPEPGSVENTRLRKDGGRACRTCAREATARHRARSKDGRR